MFLTVIYMIMGKNTITRWIFRRKSNETGRTPEPNCRKEPSEAVL